MKKGFTKLSQSIVIFLIALFFSQINFASSPTSPPKDIAIFAGGCFWCMQEAFDKVNGVTKTVVGYTGGHVPNPTYEQVSAENTGHYEAIEIFFNPTIVSYQQLLTTFWHNIDPTDAGGQFCDRGDSYRAAIFYRNHQQKILAIASKEKLIKSDRFKQVVTPILPAETFYPAEKYHQKFYQKHPVRYKFYKYNCGRTQQLKKLWD